MAPGDLIPEYELWVPRRENWLMALPVIAFRPSIHDESAETS
jgi:hypothetical protein